MKMADDLPPAGSRASTPKSAWSGFMDSFAPRRSNKIIPLATDSGEQQPSAQANDQQSTSTSSSVVLFREESKAAGDANSTQLAAAYQGSVELVPTAAALLVEDAVVAPVDTEVMPTRRWTGTPPLPQQQLASATAAPGGLSSRGQRSAKPHRASIALVDDRPVVTVVPPEHHRSESSSSSWLSVHSGNAEDGGEATDAPATTGSEAKNSQRRSMSGRMSNASQKSSLMVMSKSFSAMRDFVLGDDEGLEDKWAAHPHSSAIRRDSGETSLVDGDVSSAHQQQQAPSTTSSFALLMKAPTSLMEPQNARTIKGILRNYMQSFLFCMVIAACVIPLMYALSKIDWHVRNEKHILPNDGESAFELNRKVFQLSLMLQCAFPLSFYSVALYICMNKTWRVPMGLIICVAVVLGLSILISLLWWHYNVPFWYYYLDLILMGLVYMPPEFLVGWYAKDLEGAHWREKLKEAIWVVVLEAIVAMSTYIYCVIIMPLFFMLGAWMQLVWVCFIHPAYFELTTSFIIRKALQRNQRRGRTDICYFLGITHAMVHTVAISVTIQSSIDHIGVSALSNFLLCFYKLVWRSTTLSRDLLIEKLFKGVAFQLSEEQRAASARMISMQIQSEMLMENAGNLVGPFLVWAMYKEPMFMAIVPVEFIQGDMGYYPWYYMVALIAMLIGMTVTFDLIFLIHNYYWGQHLPVIQTWREIKATGGYYLGFVLYAFTFMGAMFLFITMILLPRMGLCKSNSYCDCHIMTYDDICNGNFLGGEGGSIL